MSTAPPTTVAPTTAPPVDKKLTELTEEASPVIDDLLYMVDDPDGTPLSRKVEIGNVLALTGLVKRGTNSGYDFTEADLTEDGTWRDLDFSSIAPSGATWVILRVVINATAAGKGIYFRENGITPTEAQAGLTNEVANMWVEGVLLVPCDTNRVIEYLAVSATWTGIKILVVGWVI